MIGVIFAGEHAAEFEFSELGFEISQLSLGFNKSFFVFSFNGQFDQTGDIFEALVQFIDSVDDLFQRGTLFTQRLRFFRIIPDGRIFQFAGDFF